MAISKKIVEYRKAKGLSQEALAERAGINLRTIQRIENDKSVPRGFTLKAIADALGTPLQDFSDVEADHVSEINERATESPKGEELLQAQLINLSAFSYLFIPYLAPLIPFFLWRNRKDIRQVYEAGKETVNFQILWTIALHISLLLITAVQIFLYRYFQIQSLITVLHVFFAMYFLNALFIIVAAVRLRKGHQRIYPRVIQIL